jgi:thiamine-monophosphate kinase
MQTKLSELGEFGLIKRLSEKIKIYNKSTIKGINDDGAVMDYGNKQVVVSTDLLIEGIHFDLAYVPLKHLGYKSIVVNLSDIYAMNAQPEQVTVSIAVSNRFSVEAIDQLYEGMRLACDFYKVDMVGGDTSSSLKGLVISVTAIGTVEKGKAVYRNGAKINDILCVTGDLGAAYMGLQLLEREKEVFKADPNMKPEFADYEYLLQRQLKPEARNDAIEFFAENQIQPTSMIDISDGLSSEILHICEQSGVGCRVYEDKIPLDAETDKFARELNIDPSIAALNGGEDYELLFTISPADYHKIRNNAAFSAIGHITDIELGTFLVSRDESEIPLQAQGWKHNE